jgi:hypothetical protein
MKVMWFSGRSCVGIVRVETQYEGIQYYIGCPPGEAKGFNEEEDTQWIADWGARFPGEVGNILFGEDPLRNGSSVQIPVNKEQAEAMVKVGMMYMETIDGER